jgi:adenosylmethionine-8-amino-7-oxononanoate aminotransferase
MPVSRLTQLLTLHDSVFVHGHTFQGHPTCCAAALEVQKIIQEDNLIDNVKSMGGLLEKLLKDNLSDHPNVGDIRGRGLFWGIELVADKKTKAPLPLADHTAMAVCEKGLEEGYSIGVYPAGGTADDGIRGDAIIISPAFTVTADEIEDVVSRVTRLIQDYFDA